MSLPCHLKPSRSHPDPKRPLSSSLPACAIASANKEVSKELESKKRGKYNNYTPSQRVEIGNYSSKNGAAAAARYLSIKYKYTVSESTVKSIKKDYMKELRRRPRRNNGEVTASIPTKKCRRKLLLGEDLDSFILRKSERVEAPFQQGLSWLCQRYCFKMQPFLAHRKWRAI